MENKKKMAFNVVFLILVFAGTIYGVFHGEDLGEIARILKTVNLLWLIPGFICVIVFIWGESIIIYYMMRTLGIKRKKWTCFLFSSVGFFFSCITPSASGGQPAQIYYMKKEKIPIPVSTLVFHPVLARTILVKGMALLERMHLMKRKQSRLDRLNASMDQYRETAVYLKNHVKVLVNVFGITLFQRFALFTATWFVYKAFGLSGQSAWLIILLQSTISVSVDMLPLPGGMGISEKLFLVIFAPIFGTGLLLPGMILSRGLGYYTELLVSAVLTIVANFTIGKGKKVRENVGNL